MREKIILSMINNCIKGDVTPDTFDKIVKYIYDGTH